MAEELIRTRCSDGFLVLTDTAIRIERKGFLGAGGKLSVLPRQALVGADMTNTMAPVFGKGGASTLTFVGNGGLTIVAKTVNPQDARRIMEILGFA